MPPRSFPFRLTVLIAMAGACSAAAQTGRLKDLGVVLHNDSSFSSVFRFRMQNRADWRHTAGTAEDNLAMQVRRFRLKLDGHLLTPRLEYKIQLGLADRDMAIGDGISNPSPLLDAFVQYILTAHTKLGFGQTKTPGGRQALVSSGEMELPERSIANNAFTLDRDIGLFAQQTLPMGGKPLRATAAITQGEGRAVSGSGNGLCFTGRVEWLPLGEFHDKGAYSEGDLIREPAPKLAVAMAYSTDRHARRTQAQRGPLFPQGDERTIGTFFADAMFKHKGWAWMGEYERRLADGPPAVMDPKDSTLVAVNEGWGLSNQLSRMLGKRSQVALRWSMVRADAEVSQAHQDRDEAMLGFSHYLNGHGIKLQSALYYNWGNGDMNMDRPGNFYGVLLQVELGI